MKLTNRFLITLVVILLASRAHAVDTARAALLDQAITRCVPCPASGFGGTPATFCNISVSNQLCVSGPAYFGTLNACTINAATGNFTGPVDITNTTPSTACTNGALTVSGGVGIAGNLNVCGTITSIGGFSGPISTPGAVHITNTTPSTGCTNGALTVSGGVGIVGNLNVCGTITASGFTGACSCSSGLGAYGYAVGQSDAVIGANADVVFDLGATPFPNAGFTSVPAPAGTSFVIASAGVYQFDFYVSGLPSTNVPLEFQLYVNGISPNATHGGPAYEFRSNTTASATDNLTVIGHGLILLAAGDVITLHNRTNTVTDTVTVTSVPPGGEAGPNRTLALEKIA